VVGTDLAAGQRPMLFIPGGTFHMSRLVRGAATRCSRAPNGRVSSRRTWRRATALR
jgi:hypothetical protein